MQTLLSLLILATAAAAPTAERYSDAVEVFHCDFGPQWDPNFDHWPDRWTRQHSPAFPHYLPVKISDDPAPLGSRPLRIDLDGGAAAVFSPPMKVSSIFSYVAEVCVKTDGLVHDEAYFSLTFYDAKHKPLETITSERLHRTTDWVKVRIEPIAPAREGTEYAVIGLHLEPSQRADVHGSASFADVWVGRLPRMTLKTDRRDNVYVDPARPTITCTASGFAEENSRVSFELLDLSGRVIVRQQQQLVGTAQSGAGLSDNEEVEATRAAGIVGTATWTPPIPDLGFYRVRVAMPGRVGVVHQRELSLALVRPQPSPNDGEFGWTLPDGENPLTLAELIDLLNHAGINWVKFPVWTSSQDSSRSDRLVWFAERLHLQHIEMVGLLHQPPADVRRRFGDTDHPLAAQIFSTEPELWYPSLEPALTSLSLKVRWWQLGLDKDTSFVGYPNAAEKIAQLRKYIARFGQQVYLGIGWSWLNELPPQPQAWDFVSLSADPPLTWEEQTAYLATSAAVKTRRWVVVEPLAKNDYGAEDRAGDLARRMLAAKMQGAEGIFVPEVFSTQRGLMNDDGTVGDLLLPWRTTALALAGAKYIGRINLPNNSVNHIFDRDGQIVMVLWNDRKIQERVYLGDDVRQTDLWGRAIKVATDQSEQVLEVGPLPVFVTGLNRPVLRWRMSVQLAETRWPSVFGVPHNNELHVKNLFGQGISGKIRLMTPEGWRTSPRDINFKLASGETLNQPFEVTLPLDAVTGRQDIRIEFDIMADRRYQFSVHRHIDVGVDDVFVQANSRLNEQGELEIEQRLTNDTDKVVSFKCFLYVPDRLPVVTQVVEQGRGTDTKIYRLPNGAELIGKNLLLRADEIAGQRIINYRFVAQP
jgi:alpha-galactosidase-like protein